MSVSIEVSELRTKVAELKNDLWHLTKQKDAAEASNLTLIKVVDSLTTQNGLLQSKADQLEKKNESLQRNLSASGKMLRNVRAFVSSNEDPDYLADDELPSAPPSSHPAKNSEEPVTPHAPPLQAVSTQSVSVPATPSPTVPLPTKEELEKKAKAAFALDHLKQQKALQAARSQLHSVWARTPIVRLPMTKSITALRPSSEREVVHQPPTGSKLLPNISGVSNTTQDVTQQGKRKRGQVDELDYDDTAYPLVQQRTEAFTLDQHTNDTAVYKNEDEIDLSSGDEDGQVDEHDSGADAHTPCGDSAELELFKNEDEIHLSLDEDVDQVDEADTDDTNLSLSPEQPAVPFRKIPFSELSPDVQALDYIRYGWEDSDDEEEVEDTETVVAPKPTPPKSPEEEEEAKARKARAVKLLTSWQDQEPTYPLAEFKVITEPPTILKTGLDITKAKYWHVSYDKDENGNYPTNPGGFQREEHIATTLSINSPPNDKIWADSDDLHNALRIQQNDDRYCPNPNLFKYGLFYTPSPAEVRENNVLRTVQIGNLPETTMIGDLMARIRGGIVVSAKIVDTMKLMGSKSALVEFFEGESAADYVDFATFHPIKFGENVAAVTLIGTPTYPIRGGRAYSIKAFGHTRCLQIAGYPKDQIPDRELVLDLSSKMTFENAVPDGFRAASMEEPYFDERTQVMHLSFSSIELAGSAYGILTGRRLYKQYDLKPKWVEDPCAGDLEELLELPPMASEQPARRSGPTHLQKLIASFKPKGETFKELEQVTMPAMPSFHFHMPMPTLDQLKAASRPKQSVAPVPVKKTGIWASIYAPKSNSDDGKDGDDRDDGKDGKDRSCPLMITSSTYKKIVPDAKLPDSTANGRFCFPKTITRGEYRSANYH